MVWWSRNDGDFDFPKRMFCCKIICWRMHLKMYKNPGPNNQTTSLFTMTALRLVTLFAIVIVQVSWFWNFNKSHIILAHSANVFACCACIYGQRASERQRNLNFKANFSLAVLNSNALLNVWENKKHTRL